MEGGTRRKKREKSQRTRGAARREERACLPLPLTRYLSDCCLLQQTTLSPKHNTTQADPAWARSVLVPGGTWREHEKAQPHKSRVWLSLVAGPARRSSEIEIGKGGGGQA